jgi:hypothetical protein
MPTPDTKPFTKDMLREYSRRIEDAELREAFRMRIEEVSTDADGHFGPSELGRVFGDRNSTRLSLIANSFMDSVRGSVDGVLDVLEPKEEGLAHEDGDKEPVDGDQEPEDDGSVTEVHF